MHGGAGVQGEAHTGGDETAGRDGHLHRQRVLQGREAQGVGVVLHEVRGHFTELPAVVHLHTPIEAVLRPGVSPLSVARALHPTSAVAGTPRAEAIGFLRAHEGFERGWYAGAVGAIGPSRLTLAVGLRSALLSGSTARVFVGAGVVRGSTPDGEWIETERKASTMLAALGVSHG